jgi:hypothetical protein
MDNPVIAAAAEDPVLEEDRRTRHANKGMPMLKVYGESWWATPEPLVASLCREWPGCTFVFYVTAHNSFYVAEWEGVDGRLELVEEYVDDTDGSRVYYCRDGIVLDSPEVEGWDGEMRSF